MQQTALAKWRPGVIDARWKRQVVEANKRKAIDVLNGLTGIVFGQLPAGVGAVDFEGQCAALRALSADDIIGQIEKYWRVTNSELEASTRFADDGDWGNVGTEAGS